MKSKSLYLNWLEYITGNIEILCFHIFHRNYILDFSYESPNYLFSKSRRM